MGDIADATINGDFDFLTGEYIGRGGGYPRNKGDRRRYNYKSGVTKWLDKRGVNREQQMKLIREYIPNSTANDSKEKLCAEISQHFPQFVKWFNDSLKTELK